MPIHCKRSNKLIPQSGTVLFCKASVVNTTTTHNKIIANERATRSRKLNDREYRNKEKPVIAMPAVKMLLMFCSPANKPSNQPLNMRTFQTTLMLSQKTTLRLELGNTGHYTHKIHNRAFVQAGYHP